MILEKTKFCEALPIYTSHFAKMNKRHYRSQPNCTLSLVFFNSFYFVERILRSLNILRQIPSYNNWSVLFYLVYGKSLPIGCRVCTPYTAKTHNTENLKQIFPKKELRGLRPNFHIQVSVSYIYMYIPTNGLPILLQENRWTDPRNRSHTHECENRN